MVSKKDGATGSFQVSAALPKNVLVKLDGDGKLELAGAADADAIGVTVTQTFNADEWTAVEFLSKEGTLICTASEALAIGDVANQAASGKFQESAGTIRRGIVLSAAGADGDYFELLPLP